MVEEKIRALRVTWARPKTEERISIGVLSRDESGFLFVRLPGYARAKDAGFWSPELERGETLSSQFLFALFAQRIPSRTRPDFERMMQDWDVDDPSDRFQILARSGGRLRTDGIELHEERSMSDDLVRPLRFRVAGCKHYDGAAHVRVGDELELKAEPTNAHDPDATLVLLHTGRTLGYVPRPYAPLFSKLLQEGAPIRAKTVRELNIPGDEHRWVALAWRESE